MGKKMRYRPLAKLEDGCMFWFNRSLFMKAPSGAINLRFNSILPDEFFPEMVLVIEAKASPEAMG